MKYCPYCGASLPDSAVSFCPECGKPILESTVGKPVEEKRKKEKPVKTKARPKKAKKPEPPAEDGYDGYYDDRLPIDEGHRRDGLDKGIIKKVAALVLCLLVVIGACLAILYVI
ncbi:zinc ribbon domain-containing protein [Acutalibacter intestini]|uniref:zinc ribbon domain-containing protein n=1 Tax=Acutalibacter intestini TaxID=3093659 RepID=UPI002AC968FA|nr:zinc ribbon domain-containing protein [Acutalibacter sp. M00204]